MNIPHTLSELQRAGLTQTQIAQALGLKQPTVSDMATGKAGTKRPSYQVISGLERLAAEYNVSTAPPPTESQPQ
jgi:predicted XRE-type DNA-binding protein